MRRGLPLLALLWAVASSRGAAAAVPQGDPLAGVIACRAIDAAAARLACYDRAVSSLAAAVPPAASTAAPPAASSAPPPPMSPVASPAAPPAAPPAAQSTAPPPAQPPRPLDPRKTFGLPESVIAEKEVAAGTRAQAIRDIQARLVGLSRTSEGRLLFRLDNGQTWRELQNDGELLARVGDPVVISRGWLGSYWLKLPSGRNCRVDRMQ